MIQSPAVTSGSFTAAVQVEKLEKNRLILKKKQEGTDMKSIKSILKIAGAVMAVIGTVLVVVGFLDEICAGVKKLAACRARREEMKDYAD